MLRSALALPLLTSVHPPGRAALLWGRECRSRACQGLLALTASCGGRCLSTCVLRGADKAILSLLLLLLLLLLLCC